MSIIDSYQTISEVSEGFFKDRGSKFYAYAIPCDTAIDAKIHIEKFRKTNPNACHVCFAWRFGLIERQYKDRYSDDGEPSNSAGKPIFGQIISFNVTNVLIAVVRIYGGTNLGVGGLMTAYKTAAKLALNNAIINNKFITVTFEIQFSYEEMGLVMNLLKKANINLIEQGFEGSLAKLTIKVRLSKKDDLKNQLDNLHTINYKELT